MAADTPGPDRPRGFHPVRDFALALGFLTLLPVRAEWPDEGAPDAVGFYPWVGWLLGGVAVGVAWLFREGLVQAGTLLTSVLVVAAWALLTRFLHWDGLADTADGLWGSHDRERRLEIMRDSRIGSFGAGALILAALLQVSAIDNLLSEGRYWPLLAAPVIARAVAALAAWTLPAARREGLGLTAVQRPSPYAVAVTLMALAAVFALPFLVTGPLSATALGFGWFTAIVVAPLLSLWVPRLLADRVGGMTGDLFGATVVLTECLVLVLGAMA